jgi:hypothetical protein
LQTLLYLIAFSSTSWATRKVPIDNDIQGFIKTDIDISAEIQEGLWKVCLGKVCSEMAWAQVSGKNRV